MAVSRSYHSTGEIEGGILDCPLGLCGGVKYEPRPGGGGAGRAIFHVTNITLAERIAADDMAFNHFLAHYPFAEARGTAWSGDAERSGVGAPDYCTSSASEFRANYPGRRVPSVLGSAPCPGRCRVVVEQVSRRQPTRSGFPGTF